MRPLCEGADPRKVRSLRLIHAICVEQQQRGGDYSVATIGRLSAERGGPAAGAIHNKTGEAYRAIIKIFADHADGTPRRRKNRSTDQVDMILEGRIDPVLKVRLTLLLAELKSARGQLLAARQIANQTATLRLDSPASEKLPPHPAETLSPLEVHALKNAVSQNTMDHWGWRADENGRIITDTGQTVFGAGFVTAIRKVLENAGPTP